MSSLPHAFDWSHQGGRHERAALGLEAATLVALLRERARSQPDDLSYKFLVDGESEEISLTYAQLERRARAIAAFLQSRLAPGDLVFLLYPPGIEYITAFFGCIHAGMVAVPTSLPHPGMPQRALARLSSIVAESGAQAALTTKAIKWIVDGLAQGNDELQNVDFLTTDGIEDSLADGWREPDIRPDSLALIQYTSGSISAPKGVALSHRNILYNQAMIMAGGRTAHDQGVVSWLPPTHDMGLFGGILHVAYLGTFGVQISPEKFLQRPARWLEAMSKHRASLTVAPNFAFDLCVSKVTQEEREALDLSSWRLVFNGAEPIRAATLEQFCQTFAPQGLRESVMYPCYGLAESTLIVSGGDATGSKVEYFDADILVRQHRAVRTDDKKRARALVGCGHALLDEKIRIVDPKTRDLCPDGDVGEIWVSGPSVARGYWKNPSLTHETFAVRIEGDKDDTGYLRTGDFGFFFEGELFITGRLKDVIIVHGRNHYPQDIEHTAARHPLARRGGTAAFALEHDGNVGVVIVQEVKPGSEADYDDVIAHILRDVAREHQLPIHTVLLTAPRTVPKTTSGKIQRRLCEKLFLSDKLPALRVWKGAATAIDMSAVPVPIHQAASEKVSASEQVCAVLIDVVHPLLVEYGVSVTERTDLSLLGVDSLKLAEILQAVAGQLLRADVNLEMNVLHEYPKLQDLAEFLHSRGLIDTNKLARALERERSAGMRAPHTAAVSDDASTGVGENFSLDIKIKDSDALPFRRRIEAFNRAIPEFFHEHYLRCIDSSMDREVRVLDRTTGEVRSKIMFGSNNYLGLANHPYVRQRVIELIDRYGVGVSGAPALNGYTTLHLDVEEHLARFKGSEACMIFSSGYNANVGLTSSLGNVRTLVVYDEFSHASFLDGLAMSPSRAIPFRHNQMNELERILDQHRSSYVDAFVAVEGLYSMDGDLAPLDEVVAIAHRYDAMVVIDDAHSTGIYGPNGEGAAAHFKVHVDITMGTFSKVLAVNGGFIAGSKELISFLRSNQRSYIFSTSIAPVTLAAVKAGLELIERDPELNQRLWDNVRYLAAELTKIGIPREPVSPIFPILFPENLDVAQACALFRSRGLFVNPIVYPAVPKSKERLRISIKASHTRQDLDRLVECFHDAWKLRL